MYVGYQTGTTVGADAAYVFTTRYLTNNGIAYNSDTGTFTFRVPGWYQISFDTTAASSTASAAVIIPTMVINGTASTSALTELVPTSTTDIRNGSFSTVIYVRPIAPGTFATMQIKNTGAGSAVTTASNIVITRIG